MRPSSTFNFNTLKLSKEWRGHWTALAVLMTLLAAYGAVVFFYQHKINEASETWNIKDIPRKVDLLKENASAQPVDVLFMGDSHMGMGVSPFAVEDALSGIKLNCFNAALHGMPVQVHYLMLKEIYDAYFHPKLIIFGVSLDMLNSRENKHKITDAAIEDIQNVKEKKLGAYLSAWSKLQNKRKIVYSRVMSTLKFPELDASKSGFTYKEDIFDKKGFSALHGRMDIKSSILPRSKLYHLNFNQAYFTELEDLILLCRNRNIDIVIMNPPAHIAYYEMLDNGTYQNYARVLEATAKKFRITFWNMQNDSIFHAHDFHEVGHLNMDGAKKLSKILARKIEDSYLSNQPKATAHPNIKNKYSVSF